MLNKGDKVSVLDDAIKRCPSVQENRATIETEDGFIKWHFANEIDQQVKAGNLLTLLEG
jgi:hypothetical protein